MPFIVKASLLGFFATMQYGRFLGKILKNRAKGAGGGLRGGFWGLRGVAGMGDEGRLLEVRGVAGMEAGAAQAGARWAADVAQGCGTARGRCD